MTGLWPSIEDQLGELNDRATAILDRMTPAPDGVPPRGSWIRAMKIDDDGRGTPACPWHHVEGWDGLSGNLSTRCRRSPGSALDSALDHYLGKAPRWRRGSWDRLVLTVEAERPAEGACRQCDIGLERDAAREVAAARAAELERLVELLPAVRSIAGDQALDDAERGRRLRELWPT